MGRGLATAALALFLSSAEAGWKLGAPGITCTQTCVGLGSCTNHEHNLTKLEVAKEAFKGAGIFCSAFRTTCDTQNKQNSCADWGAPYQHEHSTLCQYGAKQDVCDHKPVDGHHQRLCLCGKLASVTAPVAAKISCPRPANFCRETGSTYQYVDCDGDDTKDHTCFDSLKRSVILDKGGACTKHDNVDASMCRSAFPTLPPTQAKTCPRPSNFCSYTNSRYMNLDCDGDGKKDHACHSPLAAGVILVDGSGSCKPASEVNGTWPQGKEADCPAGFSCFSRGIDFWGADIKNVGMVADPHMCQRECLKIHNCEFFTYNMVKKDCWLKWKRGARRTLNREVISGPAACTNCINRGFDNYGGDLQGGHSLVRHVDDCQRKCEETARCKYFTFSTYGHCWLKSSQERVDGNRLNLIAGTASCAPPPKYCYSRGVEYMNANIATIEGIDGPVSCQAECQKNAACKFWSYSRILGKRCYLNDDRAGRWERDNLRVISGPKLCPPGSIKPLAATTESPTISPTPVPETTVIEYTIVNYINVVFKISDLMTPHNIRAFLSNQTLYEVMQTDIGAMSNIPAENIKISQIPETNYLSFDIKAPPTMNVTTLQEVQHMFESPEAPNKTVAVVKSEMLKNIDTANEPQVILSEARVYGKEEEKSNAAATLTTAQLAALGGAAIGLIVFSGVCVFVCMGGCVKKRKVIKEKLRSTFKISQAPPTYEEKDGIVQAGLVGEVNEFDPYGILVKPIDPSSRPMSHSKLPPIGSNQKLSVQPARLVEDDPFATKKPLGRMTEDLEEEEN